MRFLILLFLLLESGPCKGLFLDQVLSDCHGLPFLCHLRENQNTNAAMTPFTGNGNTNMQSQPGVSNPGVMADNLGSASNPADMTSVVKQDTSNQFYDIQQSMMSGKLGNSMTQGMSYTGSDNAGQISGQQQSTNTMFGPGMMTSNNQPQASVFGPGGMSQGPQGMSGFPGGGGPGGMGSGSSPFSVGSGMSGQGVMSGMQGGMSGTHSGMSNEGAGGSNEQMSSNNPGDDGGGNVVCQADWTTCPQRCISLDSTSGCPTCTCKVDNHEENTIHVTQVPPTDFDDVCGPFPDNCPSACVEFNDLACMECSCEVELCPVFPSNCPRGHSKIDDSGCPVCMPHTVESASSQNDENDAVPWYDKLWSKK